MTNTNNTVEINNKLTVEEIKGRLQDAHVLRSSLTSHMATEVLPRTRQVISAIRKDQELTYKGQQAKIERYQKQQEVRLLDEIHTLKKSHGLLLADAKASAEAILIADVEQPDETAQALFNMRKQKLQSAIMYAPTPQAKLKALSDFAELGNEGQAFARQIQGDFQQLSLMAMNSTTNPGELQSITKTLGTINAKLENAAYTEEQQEVAQLLQSIDENLDTRFVNTAVLGTALSEISQTTLEYANKTDQYEIAFAEDVAEYEQAKNLALLIK
ncbi:hypothetical protein CN445_21845 [Bacillus cereus]|nr:hypothetical protein CN445_21845 [Bacillus cereus]